MDYIQSVINRLQHFFKIDFKTYKNFWIKRRNWLGLL